MPKHAQRLPEHGHAIPSKSQREDLAASDRAQPLASGAILQRAALAPQSLRPADILRLQQTLGNRAVAQLLSQSAENRTGLPDQLKAGIETLSGLSLDDVRVHYNSPRPAALGALAYAQGTDIHVGPGQERCLPHEAWHVVQQKQGRVQPTLQSKGALINDAKELEQEADVIGAKALQATTSQPTVDTFSAETATNLSQGAATARGVVQRAATTLHFTKNLTGESKITATNHQRGPVHKTASDWLFDNGAWKSTPNLTVCNHSKDYNTMAQKILDAIHDKKLAKAAKTITATHETLKKNNQGLGAATSKHKSVMDGLIADPTDDANLDNVTDAFNYYIYKICDYPRNLFFWPDKTGGDPDLPRGEYENANVPHTDWKEKNPIISKKKRLSVEKNRLKDGQDDLEEALP